tara:strand:+ start:2566 stop:4470 length:1905 start_codon:yes stop_codon:yes gene_type:complete
MINKITIQNFKSIKDRVEIDIKPITLLFGPNSAGKSTVVQALHYLKEVIQYDNPDPGKTAVGGNSIDLGGFKNIVHRESGDSPDHYKTKDIIIGIEIEESDYLEPETFEDEFQGAEDLLREAGYSPYFLEFTISWDERLNRPIVKRYDVTIKDQLIGRIEMTGYVSDDIHGKKDGLDIEELRKQTKLESIRLQRGDIPRFNLKWIDIDHPDFIWPDEIQKKEKTTSILEADDDTVVENIFKLYLNEFDNILIPIKLNKIKGLDGKEVEVTGLPVSVDPDTFDSFTNSNHTLFHGNHAFPNFNPISIAYGGTSFSGMENLTSTDLKTERRKEIDPDEFSSALYGMDEEAYKRKSIEKALSHVFSTPILLLRDYLKNLRYIGPVRSLPGRDFTPESYYGEHNWSDGLGAWSHIHGLINNKIVDKANDIDRINAWMEKLGLGYSIKARSVYKIDEESPLVYGRDEDGNEFEDYSDLRTAFRKMSTTSEAVLIEHKNRIEVKPNDVGSGITQVFPLIVASVHDEHSVLAIEQPELHVHPRIQQRMADMLVSKYSDSTIYLIETHSEHLLLRILRRINETFEEEQESEEMEIQVQDVSLVYVEPGVDGVKMRSILIDQTSGDLVDYPEGFFDERSEDLL